MKEKGGEKRKSYARGVRCPLVQAVKWENSQRPYEAGIF